MSGEFDASGVRNLRLRRFHPDHVLYGYSKLILFAEESDAASYEGDQETVGVTDDSLCRRPNIQEMTADTTSVPLTK